MTTRSKTKETTAPTTNSKGKDKHAPLEQKRRYVRLEIFSPVSYYSIVTDEAQRARRHPAKKAGLLLNLSGGGVLISTTDNVLSNEFVLLTFEIKGFDALTSVLGRVKRVEECEDGERLVGVEFLTPEQVDDPVLATSLSRLSDNPLGFSDSLRRLISRFVFQRQVETEPKSK
ncbi:MAG: PilZ domain-containing protein [candidate division Zixibacteria bacterium]|nr:PilZ domain-containing protein [candidate division Zixibacteria bacterium]